MTNLSFGRMTLLLVCLSILYSALSDRYIMKYVSGDHQISEGVPNHCDLDKCDSIYRKCTLTNRCDCDFKRDHMCVKNCIDCLEEKLSVCCSCFGRYKHSLIRINVRKTELTTNDLNSIEIPITRSLSSDYEFPKAGLPCG